MEYYVEKKKPLECIPNTVYALGLFSDSSSQDTALSNSEIINALPEELLVIASESVKDFSEEQGLSAGNIRLVNIKRQGDLSNCALILIGLGDKVSLDYTSLRRYTALITRLAKDQAFNVLQLLLPISCYQIPKAELAILEGIDLSVFVGLWVRLNHHYKSDKYLASDWEGLRLREVYLVDASCSQKMLNGYRNYCRAVHLSRELVATPANIANPQELLNHAIKISDAYGLSLTVLDEKGLEKHNMNGMLAVSNGLTRPLFLHLQYKPDSAEREAVALIGLGITFDPDGLSKGHSMTIEGMKKNMAGAASVLAAAEIIGRTKPNRQVDFILPLAERDRSLRPGDLLTLSNGETVEINGANIEGHLMLAEAFIYAQSINVNQFLSIATLNNAAIACLGNKIAPLWSTSELASSDAVRAGDIAGEKLWPMPVVDEHRDSLVSPFADYRTPKAELGAGLTALFLRQFIGESVWNHIDISGTCWSAIVDGYLNAGATGWGLGTMVNWVEHCE